MPRLLQHFPVGYVRGSKAVHIALPRYRYADASTFVILDDANELPVPVGEIDRSRRALYALRQATPGIRVDAEYTEFEERRNLAPLWTNTLRIDSFMRRKL